MTNGSTPIHHIELSLTKPLLGSELIDKERLTRKKIIRRKWQKILEMAADPAVSRCYSDPS